MHLSHRLVSNIISRNTYYNFPNTNEAYYKYEATCMDFILKIISNFFQICIFQYPYYYIIILLLRYYYYYIHHEKKNVRSQVLRINNFPWTQ